MRVFTDQGPPAGFTRPDSVYGHTYYPNCTIRYRSPVGEFSTIIKTNSLGFRDDQHSFQKPENIKRLLIAGDSFAVGREVAFESVLSEVLERMLQERHYPYEVITTAADFYSPVKQYLLFKNIGRRFQPGRGRESFDCPDTNGQPGESRGVAEGQAVLEIRGRRDSAIHGAAGSCQGFRARCRDRRPGSSTGVQTFEHVRSAGCTSFTMVIGRSPAIVLQQRQSSSSSRNKAGSINGSRIIRHPPP